MWFGCTLRGMSTNVIPAIITILTNGVTADFTFDARPDADLVAMLRANADMADVATLVPAPYTDPRMADVERHAVVIDDDTAVDGYRIIGRVIRCGPRSWEAFNANASHSFGRFRSPSVAAGYVAWSVEW